MLIKKGRSVNENLLDWLRMIASWRSLFFSITSPFPSPSCAPPLLRSGSCFDLVCQSTCSSLAHNFSFVQFFAFSGFLSIYLYICIWRKTTYTIRHAHSGIILKGRFRTLTINLIWNELIVSSCLMRECFIWNYWNMSLPHNI